MLLQNCGRIPEGKSGLSGGNRRGYSGRPRVTSSDSSNSCRFSSRRSPPRALTSLTATGTSSAHQPPAARATCTSCSELVIASCRFFFKSPYISAAAIISCQRSSPEGGFVPDMDSSATSNNNDLIVPLLASRGSAQPACLEQPAGHKIMFILCPGQKRDTSAWIRPLGWCISLHIRTRPASGSVVIGANITRKKT